MATRLAPQRNFVTITPLNGTELPSPHTMPPSSVPNVSVMSASNGTGHTTSTTTHDGGRITIVNTADCEIITITKSDLSPRLNDDVDDPLQIMQNATGNDDDQRLDEETERRAIHLQMNDGIQSQNQKFILPPGTTVTGVSVIDGVEMLTELHDDPSEHLHQQQHQQITNEPEDSNDGDPIAISLVDPLNAVLPISGASSPNSLHGSSSQQLTAQVAVVQSPDDMEPHYITVTAIDEEEYVAQHDNVTTQETYHVQYVDSEQLYNGGAQGQNQMPYPVYTVGDYASNSQQYYTTAPNPGYGNSPTSSSQGGAANHHQYLLPTESEQMHMSSRSGGESPSNCISDVSYISQQASTTPTNSESESAPSLSHATRVSPATVSWLMENYENADGVSLPRSTLYNHYMAHCNEHKLDAVNAASFGKLIRSVFNGLRTRRLGTRGNSKYHYYGIRVKSSSGLSTGSADESAMQMPSSSKHVTSSTGGGSAVSTTTGSVGLHVRMRKAGLLSIKAETYEACTQFLGDGHGAMPSFPMIEFNSPLPDDITLDDVDTLRSMYREHCEAFLDAIHNLEFSLVESLWREFWRAQDNNNGDECEEEKYLSKYKLYTMSQCPAVQEFVRKVDYTFYQNMVDVLIPDVLRPIPSSLTQAIRNFSKNLEGWLTSAMTGCPESIVQIKVGAVVAFSQTLRRYTSLNHLAQAARAVLHNNQQISQMLNDLNRVDFHNVQEQASWVCQCDPIIVQKLESEFKSALQQQNTLEQWAAWLRQVVDNALVLYRGKPSYEKAARQFLLNWSFYSSMVIRDLTLRSAASFGSFHLIRLLYDEYMFFIVEHKVAEATNTTPISVMMGQAGGSAANSSIPTQLHREMSDQSDLDMMFTVDEYEPKCDPGPKRMRSA